MSEAKKQIPPVPYLEPQNDHWIKGQSTKRDKLSKLYNDIFDITGNENTGQINIDKKYNTT